MTRNLLPARVRIPEKLMDPTLNASLHAINDNGGRDRHDLVRGWFGGRPRLGTATGDLRPGRHPHRLCRRDRRQLPARAQPHRCPGTRGRPGRPDRRAADGRHLSRTAARRERRRGDRGLPRRIRRPGLGDEHPVRRDCSAAGRPRRRRHPAGRGHLQIGTDGAAHPRPFRARSAFRRSSPAPAQTARAKPRSRCWHTRWTSYSHYPNGC